MTADIKTQLKNNYTEFKVEGVHYKTEQNDKYRNRKKDEKIKGLVLDVQCLNNRVSKIREERK